jgi:hypothetical protein
MALTPGILLLTLIPLGWEVYFVYGFVAAAAAIFTAIWQDK